MTVEAVTERRILIAENLRLQRVAEALPKGSPHRMQVSKEIQTNIIRLTELKKTLGLEKTPKGKAWSTQKHKVTDHALVRYLERVHKIPMEKIKDQMLRGITPVQNGEVHIPGGRLVFKDGFVCTFFDEFWKNP